MITQRTTDVVLAPMARPGLRRPDDGERLLMASQKQPWIYSPALIGWLSAHGIEPVRAGYIPQRARDGGKGTRPAYFYEDTKHFRNVRGAWRDLNNATTRAFLERFTQAICQRERAFRTLPRLAGSEIRFGDGGAT